MLFCDNMLCWVKRDVGDDERKHREGCNLNERGENAFEE